MALRTFFASALFATIFTTSTAWCANEQVIRFGSVAEDIPLAMHQRLSPLTNYLSNEIGQRVVLTLSPNMSKAVESLTNGDVELAYLTPVAYINAHENGNAKLIAKAVTNLEAYFRLEIIVRDDSLIQKVSDLEGKRFALGDPAALLQRATVVHAGMPLEKLGSVNYLGHYDNIVRGVLNKDFDAGITTHSKAQYWEKKGLRVIYSSPKLPPYNISANGNMDKTLIEKLRKALIKLSKNDPEQRKVLEALGDGYDGFQRTNNAEYDIVRQLIKPFQK